MTHLRFPKSQYIIWPMIILDILPKCVKHRQLYCNHLVGHYCPVTVKKNVDLFETLINFIPRYKLILLYLAPLFSFICLQLPFLFVLSTFYILDPLMSLLYRKRASGLSNYMCTACIVFIVELLHHAFYLWKRWTFVNL